MTMASEAITSSRVPTSTGTPKRRGPMHTCANSALVTLHKAFDMARDQTGPIGTVMKRFAVPLTPFLPLLCAIQHRWLAIISFADERVLEFQEIFEAFIPPSAHLFKKIDNVARLVESLPQKFEDVAHKVQASGHHVLLDFAVAWVISWLYYIVSTLAKWGSTYPMEKEITVDINCDDLSKKPSLPEDEVKKGKMELIESPSANSICSLESFKIITKYSYEEMLEKGIKENYEKNDVAPMAPEVNDNITPTAMEEDDEKKDDVAPPPPTEVNDEKKDDVAPPPTEVNDEKDDVAPPDTEENDEEDDVPPPATKVNDEKDNVASTATEENEEKKDDLAPPATEDNDEKNDEVASTATEENEEKKDDLAPSATENNDEMKDDVGPMATEVNDNVTPTSMDEDDKKKDNVAPLPTDVNDEKKDDVAPPSMEENDEEDDVSPPATKANEEEKDNVASTATEENEEEKDDVPPPATEDNDEMKDDVGPTATEENDEKDDSAPTVMVEGEGETEANESNSTNDSASEDPILQLFESSWNMNWGKKT